MGRFGAIVAKEIREALPATIFFLILLHLIALTGAVSRKDYSMTALRAASTTVGALLVAKAVLIVDALPLSRRLSNVAALRVLWRTLFYGIVVALFKAVEELFHGAREHGSLTAAIADLTREISWPLVAVASLWVTGGLLVYSAASELVSAVGSDRIKAIFFGKP